MGDRPDRRRITRRQAMAKAACGVLAGAATMTGARAAAAQGAAPRGEPLAPVEPPTRLGPAPVVTPNGASLPWRLVDGVKIYHLVVDAVDHEFAPGLRARTWGYSGRVHGPTIEAVEGDRLRIYVTNRLPAATSVHWHGLHLPSGMDGVGGLTQPNIRRGETFKYEFTLRQRGTFMYHSHHDEATQMAMGMTGLFVAHARSPTGPRIDRDFAILLHEWRIDPGTARPVTTEMTDFNVLTMNAKVFPATAPLVVRTGQRVRIRFGNLSVTDHHPIHLHGYTFWVVGTDGGDIPPSAQWPASTVLVPVGATRTIEFVAAVPGDWLLHCHMPHHMMNQMGHAEPNVLGARTADADAQIRRLVPGYMPMGREGMAEMGHGGMALPENTITMAPVRGPFDSMALGGMTTVLKVRDDLTTYADPGWYGHPPGTVASAATQDELRRDGVTDGT